MLGAVNPRRCSAYRSSRISWSKKCASHNQSFARVISYTYPPSTHSDRHTNSLEAIKWCRGWRRVEPVPLSPTPKASGIARGDLLNPFLDARLCCRELSLSDHIFHISSTAGT